LDKYKGYRQIFVKNFTIVYRIEKKKKRVIVTSKLNLAKHHIK